MQFVHIWYTKQGIPLAGCPWMPQWSVLRVQSNLMFLVWSEKMPSEVLKLLCVVCGGDTMSRTCVLKSCVWNMVSVAPELSVEVSVVTEECYAVQIKKESDVSYIFYVLQAYQEIPQPLLDSVCEKRLKVIVARQIMATTWRQCTKRMTNS